MDSDDEQFQQAVDLEFRNLVAAVQREAEEAEEAAAEAAVAVGRPFHHRRFFDRDHVGADRRLMEDNFNDNARYPPEVFRRRFRMSKNLFVHIATCLAQRFRCFNLRYDAIGRPGLSTFQKCTMMGETTGLQTLRQFCRGIKDIFKGGYLRKPPADDCQRLIAMHGTAHHFLGMLGSIDCMHWEWRNCPVAWKGQFTSGFKGRHPTMILEAIADYRLRIWHAYLGVAGSNNDINVLRSSHLFND
ncbi:uncharacterized protein LOC121757738 [Salvia splendens]|uniref:uncharacterized protein LOC121757738 n=1 Tax=Salvia splendens TaxID=180675 RepID=UPI001C25BA01|nr:uncharacterized protein LOC121757738 [Salvia splendens]